jgi:hypothetical protein
LLAAGLVVSFFKPEQLNQRSITKQLTNIWTAGANSRHRDSRVLQ